MYFPLAVDLRNDPEQTKIFQNNLVHNEYYYLIEHGNIRMNCQLKILDDFHAAKKIVDFSNCDLVLLGKNRNQLMPPYFGVKYSTDRAYVVEFICYLLNDSSIENDILMLIEYLKIKHHNIKELSMPSSIIFKSNLYEVSNINGKSVISWK